MGLIASALKMVFPKYPQRYLPMGRLGDERDYQWYVGDGSASPLVDACLAFIIHGFTQMYPVVVRSEPDDIDQTEILASHPAAVTFRRPGYDPESGRSWYSWMNLIAGLVVSYCVDGNAYLLKVRGAGGAGRPVQLWYIPHFMIEPRWDLADPTRFITQYDYSPNGMRLTEGPTPLGAAMAIPLRVEDVIHLRDGLDPQNTRKGAGKVKKILREIYTDEEAARFTASLLRNQGVPGIVISPELPNAKEWTTDETEMFQAKERLIAEFSGDNRGRPVIMRGPTKIEQYGFSPEAMKLRDVRSVPEERISAELGIPAAVVGFGAGLERTKVGRTMAEFVDLAWQNGILPRARVFAAELTEQYLTEFETGAAVTHEFAFDTQRVPIMAEYHKSQAERHEILMRASLEDRFEGRRALGFRTGPRDKVYTLPAGTVEVPSDRSIEDAPALALAPAPAAAALPAPKPGSGDDVVPLDEEDVVIDKSQMASVRVLARAMIREMAVQRDIDGTKSVGSEQPLEIHTHTHIESGAFPIDATTHVDKGAVQIHKGAIQADIQVDAPMTIEQGAVHVEPHIETGSTGGFDIERDENRVVTGVRPK